MRETIGIKKSYKSFNLTKLDRHMVKVQREPPKHTDVYLLLQCSLCEQEDELYNVKYISLNNKHQKNLLSYNKKNLEIFLPTTRPKIYLDDHENILNSFKVKVNETCTLNVYILKNLYHRNIFNYKINNVILDREYLQSIKILPGIEMPKVKAISNDTELVYNNIEVANVEKTDDELINSFMSLIIN